MTPVWLEVHVDDVLLAQEPLRWPDAAALLDRLATVAEAEGGRLSFRVRAAFASGDSHNFLVGLVARGHEVGAHAHGRDLRRGVLALRRAGIHPTVFAPGLVQVGARGRLPLLHAAKALGARRLTDRTETRHFAYQGWLAWEPVPGLPSTDVSVSPFDWGVCVRDGRRVRPAFGHLDWARLGELTGRQVVRRPPPGAAAFFGATFHEHDVCPEGSLRPVDFDGMARWVARFRPIPSGDVPVSAPEPHPGRRPRPVAALVRRWRGLRRHLVHTEWLPVGERRIAVRRVGPAHPRGALVVVHGGVSGVAQGLGVFGLPDDALDDVAVWTFARTEGVPRTPGNPVHVEDTRAVLARARAEGVPTGLLTWSAGVVPALLAADDQVAFLVDVEGPADRWSLVPPRQPAHELAGLDPWDDAAWAGREAVDLLPRHAFPYLRIQGTDDHQHGAMTWHARRMVQAARNGRLLVLPGRVHDHGAAVQAQILRCFRADGASPEL